MRYIVDVILETKKKRTYLVDAKNEEQAKERLKLRLPPKQREDVQFDSIKIDPKSFVDENPFGIYNED